MSSRIRGCGTAIVTPMHEDGAVDHDALERFVEWQIEEGIHFLVAVGSTGEAATLSPTERREVVATVARVAGGRVPVVAGATLNETLAAAREAEAVVEAGADVVLSATPYYNRPPLSGLRKHFEAICRAAGVPILLYNVPGRTGLNLTAEATLALAEIDGVVGIKESSGNLEQAMRIFAGKPADFTLLSGEDALALPLVAAGAEGVISVVANEAPGPMSRLVASALSGDFATAREEHYRLFSLMEANFVATNPIPVKWALARMGKIRGGIRLPLVPLEGDACDVVQDALLNAGVLDR